MNPFDLNIIHFFNGLCHRSQLADAVVVFLSEAHLLKGGVFMTLIWFAWFSRPGREEERQRFAISTLVACFLAMFTARVLAQTIPFRPRPLHNPELNLALAYTLDPNTADRLSAFPSDHAALFFALASSFFFLSKRWGVLTLVYSTLFIAFPRLYLGLHHPTDILAGAFVGVCATFAAHRTRLNRLPVDLLLNWRHVSPGSFFAFFFLFTYQIATMFEDTRKIIHFAYSALHGGAVT